MPDFFFLYAAVDGRHAHRRFYSIVDTIFIGWSAGELGLCFGGRYLAAGDDVRCGRRHAGNRCGNYYRPVERGSGNLRLARLSLGNMLVWQVLFSLLMMTVVKCFLTDILRLFGATDELMPGAVRYSRILIYGNLAYMLVTGVLAVIRNDGRPVLSMWLMVGGLLLNIVMDYVFIFSARRRRGRRGLCHGYRADADCCLPGWPISLPGKRLFVSTCRCLS